jgi:tartrate dehydrogenase/decarboxylase/D-malate dehydrogenase
LFGDILTDLGAALAGGIGLAAGANINPERDFPSMFEPIHGSAPDIAGKGIGNPLASIWSASQMLDFFGYEAHGKVVLKAIEQLLLEDLVLTPDMNGTASTSDVGDRVTDLISSIISSKDVTVK